MAKAKTSGGWKEYRKTMLRLIKEGEMTIEEANRKFPHWLKPITQEEINGTHEGNS